MIKEAKRLAKINEYYFSRKLAQIAQMNAEGANVLNLGIGSPDLDPSPAVIKELQEVASLKGINGYQGYKGIPQLRKAIADWNKRIYRVELNPESEVLPLMGSKEGIMHISLAFVNPGDEVLVPNPGYPTYTSVSDLVGAVVKPYTVSPDKPQAIDINEIRKLVSTKTKIMWLNFPHMPTGILADKTLLKQLVELAKEKNFLLVNDNPYSTILCEEYVSIFQLPGAKEVCIELNSLSKSHNMAGWRIGWAAGNTLLLQSVLKVKSNMDSGMYLPLQRAAVKALEADERWIKKLNTVYAKRRELAWKILEEIGCTFDTKKGGMFVWGRIPRKAVSSEEVSETLLQKAAVFITPGFIFGTEGERYIRISLCSPEKNLKEALKRIKKSKDVR